MKIDFINIIHALIIWQSLLFAIVLLSPKYRKKTSNLFLAPFLLRVGAHFTYNVLYTNALLLHVLPAYSCSYGYLYGPLLYLYIRFHLREDAHFKSTYWIHFLPFSLIIVSILLGYKPCNILSFWLLPVMIIYSLLGFREIRYYKRVIQQLSAGNNLSETKWLTAMLIIMVLLLLLNAFQYFYPSIYLSGLEISLEPIVQLGVWTLINIISYQGFKNPQYFQQVSTTDLALVASVQRKPSPSSELQALATRLEDYMQQHKPYLDSELDLTTLAQTMDIHPKSLSQAINQVLSHNFRDYINAYRLEEAKILLQSSKDDKLTMMEVMYAVGFHSRSVFNTVFKQKTGMTPGQYYREVRSRPAP